MGNRNRTNPFEARRKQLERRLVAVEREMKDSRSSAEEPESLGARVWRMIKERRNSGTGRSSDGLRSPRSGRGETLRISADTVQGDESPEKRQKRDRRFSFGPKEVSLAGDAMGLGQTFLLGAMGTGLARSKNEQRNRIVVNILVILFFMIAFWMFFTGGSN